MIKLTKGAITALSISSAGVIAGGTVTAGILLKDTQQEESSKEKTSDPLNRGKEYHHYSIINKLKTNEKLNDLITLQKVDNNFFFIVDEKKFINNFKTIVQETLQQISLFSTNWNSYKLLVTYKVENTNCIKIDLVWYLPESKIKYFDQFDLLLEVG